MKIKHAINKNVDSNSVFTLRFWNNRYFQIREIVLF